MKALTPVLLLTVLAAATAPRAAAQSSDEPSGVAAPVATETEKQLAAKVERPDGEPTLTSGLNVPASETFHLGERQTGDFTVSAKNRGRTKVALLTLRGKKRQLIGVVAPGETAVRRFQSGDGVLVRNLSNESPARLYVEVWGTRNLAMYYKNNAEEPAVDVKEK